MRRFTSSVFAGALVTCFAVYAGAASYPMPRTGAEGPRVWWSLAPEASTRPALADSQVSWERWRARLANPVSEGTALHVLADARLAAGDTAGADSCWRTLAGRTSPWQLGALLDLVALTQARHGVAAAESMLSAATLFAPNDRETATLLARRAALRATVGDLDGARVLARTVIKSYPGVVPQAGDALALLESLAMRSGDSLDVGDLRAGVEVDLYRGARSSAISRLKRVIGRTPRSRRSVLYLYLSDLLRQARMPLTALMAADSAAATDSVKGSELVLIRRARALRDAGSTDSALALYARVGRTNRPVGSPDWDPWWEYAREAQDRGRYREALFGFERCTQSGSRRTDDARFQAGLVYFVLGERDSAAMWLRRAHGENARFWLAIASRAADREAADSLLRGLATLPGYGFYRAAARETLGISGWRDIADCAVTGDEPPTPVADDVRALLLDGRAGDANDLVQRWFNNDTRVRSTGDRTVSAVLGLAAFAYDAGRYALGTRLAEFVLSDGRFDAQAWRVVPWAYPPAFESEVVAAEVESLGVDRALLWALVRQESRFDPRARSRSDALGLTQLKTAAARDMARQLRDPVPSDEALFDPARALRYGSRYLAQLLRRFDGHVSVALVAYNAGPGTIRPDWRALVARGGDALFCELASNADSQDYVRRITGFRSAYRELRPTTAR